MLTGKDIHAAFREHDSSARTWDDVTPKGQEAYNAVAEKLNASHIAPLQGLVREYEALLQKEDDAIEKDDGANNDCLYADIFGKAHFEETHASERLELQKRAKQLIGEEHKDATNA